ncbi:hypothetical protein [Methylobacterium sp. D48H]
MSDAAALQPAPDAGADDDLLLRLADILSGRRDGGRLSLDEAEALAPRTTYEPVDMANVLLPLAMRRT